MILDEDEIDCITTIYTLLKKRNHSRRARILNYVISKIDEEESDPHKAVKFISDTL